MKAHIPLIVLTLASLVACAAKDSSPAPSPVSPGTLETSTASTNLGLGSYQGPIYNNENEIQAILTLDVWEKNGQSAAQLTVSPGRVSAVIPFEAGAQTFSAQLESATSGLIVKGSWNGLAWVGEITDGTKTNSFVLKAGASKDAAVAVGAPSGTFDGTLIYKGSGGKQNVSLVLSTPNTLGDVLAQTLTAKVNLGGTLKYSPTNIETLKNVIWDRETSTLTADGTVLSSLGVASLSCKMSELNAGDKDVLQCALSNSKQVGPVATGSLSQKRVVVAPPYAGDPGTQPPVQPNPIPQPTPPPAPTPYNPPPTPPPVPTPVQAPTPLPVPVPTPTIIVKNEKVFVGTGVFTNEQGAQQTRTLSLTVSLRDVLLGVDQEAVVKFIIDGSRVGAKFTDATYNSATGQLKAKEILSLGPIAGSLKLSCGGVPFAAGAYNFVCHYESSVTNVTGEFRLQGLLN